jgi:iron complex transport system substrate-binding protein
MRYLGSGGFRAAVCAAVLLRAAACAPPPAPTSSAAPSRIVSLAPNLTEIVFALGAGDRLVGRTSACTWPEPALAVPVIGGFGRPSLERLLEAKPDLILDVDLEDEQLGAAMARSGLRRERIACGTLDEIAPAVRRVGELLGTREAAEELAGRIERDLTVRRARAGAGPRPRVYLEIWPDPPMTAGSRAFVSEMVELAGGANVGVEKREYYTLSSETILQRDPEVILALYPAQADSVLARFKARPGWSQVSALRSDRVVCGLDLDLILRPGPRVGEGLDGLEAALRPPATP